MYQTGYHATDYFGTGYHLKPYVQIEISGAGITGAIVNGRRDDFEAEDIEFLSLICLAASEIEHER